MAKTENKQVRTPSAPSNPLIAIVDDDLDCATIVAEFLEMENLRTQIYSSAEAILDAGPQQYQAILLDIRLPGMWGSECGFQLRKKGYRGPIIAISGNINYWDKDDLNDLGFTDALSKPFDPQQLLVCVMSAISKYSHQVQPKK
jgi:FixJ family two-component response regulator